MTKLRLHDRSHILGDIESALAAALVRCFGNHPSPSETDRQRATKGLMDLRDQQHWIACGCRPSEVDPPPLMAPRLRDGQIHIWRHGATPHAEACPFWVEITESERPASDGVDGVMKPWQGRWLLLNQVAQDVSQSAPAAPSQAPRSPASNVPAIARLLFTALTDVGYTTVLPSDVITRKGHHAQSKTKNAYAGLDALLDQAVAPRLKLRDVGCTFLPGLSKLMQNMPAISGRFPSGTRPQGLFVGIVHEIEKVSPNETQLLWRGTSEDRVATVNVRGDVKRPGYTKGNAGPFWVIAQIAQPRGEKAFSLVNAYAHPCLSKSVLLAVDSGLERETAEILLSQLTYWVKPDTFNVEVQLQKPLFPEVLPDGTSCHPDFVLWLPRGKRIIVETMGLDKDPDYLASKAITHPRMKSLPGVVGLVEHHPNDDPNQLRRLLTAAVAGALRSS
ncbi:hypothetical protein RKE25_22630 (plasmid) [Dyella sp. BiH032]|uniref:hypothetical protein n=1 Tax=Dyella sp. BiH032 TaxID=3075430 RepID=UPI0028931ECE|nr:hypothetical protein [Dyella sp. BiH032]WNL48331.1 hypothetical protein RKE25_22630 [Dyella sp. BiH032]